MNTSVVEGFRLVVFLEPEDKQPILDGKAFCCESEQEASRIEEFSRRSGKLPYSRTFVSIAVIGPNEDICKSAARIYGDDYDGLERRTQYAILKTDDSVLNYINIAGRDDLRQLLSQISDKWKRGELYDSMLRMAKDMRSMNRSQKLEALCWATVHSGNHGYSEARLNRCMTADDVADWESCD
jgi:hypothetical protein